MLGHTESDSYQMGMKTGKRGIREMARRLGQRTYQFTQPISITASAAIGSKKESEGPMAEYFDTLCPNSDFGENTWEKAESRMQKDAVAKALEKAGVAPGEVDYIFAGDLLNQCIGSTYGLRDFSIPFLGAYGACSTMAESLGLAGVFLEGGGVSRCVAATSSHFCSAERQFRFPLEYGGQRPPTSQWTVTGAGACVLDTQGQGPFLREFTAGQIVDYGIADANNMGAAMAPAAADTLLRYFQDTHTGPDSFDGVVTGDLGAVGSELLYDLLAREGISLREKHLDCGLLIYDRKTQDVHAGGSGCGCCATMLCGYFLPKLRKGEWRELLFCATGALMSPTSVQQGQSIPGIAHALRISSTPAPQGK